MCGFEHLETMMVGDVICFDQHEFLIKYRFVLYFIFVAQFAKMLNNLESYAKILQQSSVADCSTR